MPHWREERQATARAETTWPVSSIYSYKGDGTIPLSKETLFSGLSGGGNLSPRTTSPNTLAVSHRVLTEHLWVATHHLLFVLAMICYCSRVHNTLPRGAYPALWDWT